MSDKRKVRTLAHQLERISWLLVFLAMLTQVSTQSFPSYNMVLGFWGAFCSFTQHARATFGLIIFSFFAILLDIVFCSVNGAMIDSHFFRFCLTLFIFCLFVKIYQVYIAAQFFAGIGGAQAMESSTLTSSALYDSLPEQDLEYSATGGYYPPSSGNSGFYSNHSGFEAAESSMQQGGRDSIASLPPPSKPYPPHQPPSQPTGQRAFNQNSDSADTNPMWTGTASV